MAEPSTLARPYAEAAFRLADEGGRLVEWSAALAELAAVLADARVRAAVSDPALSHQKAAGVVLGVLAGRLSGDAGNFVRVLSENGRLELLGEIRTQFEALKDEREGVIEADIATALELSQEQLADLVARLEKKSGRRVRARVALEPALIGGVRVTLGDRVIDGSARAQLEALENILKA